MHHMRRAADILLVPDYVKNSANYSRCSMVDRSVGSVHMGFGLCALGAGGRIDTHFHSFEESFYILEGEPTLEWEQEKQRWLASCSNSHKA